jgi:hypothetical protein
MVVEIGAEDMPPVAKVEALVAIGVECSAMTGAAAEETGLAWDTVADGAGVTAEAMEAATLAPGSWVD